MSFYSEEVYDVYRETYITARKHHTCGACKLPILPGHRYCRVFTLYEGETETIKRCGACQTTHLHLRELCRKNGRDLWPDERLACGLRYDDEWGGEPPAAVAALPFLSADERGALLSGRRPGV